MATSYIAEGLKTCHLRAVSLETRNIEEVINGETRHSPQPAPTGDDLFRGKLSDPLYAMNNNADHLDSALLQGA